jgi:hypothetical protein
LSNSRKVYTATGANFVFDFKAGKNRVVELVFEDDELNVDIFEGAKGYFYDDKEHLARIRL